MEYNIKTNYEKTLSDTYTPVELYLKIRDKFPESFLLESSDHKSKENSYSYLCFNPIASFLVENNKTKITYPDSKEQVLNTNEIDVSDKLYNFCNSFKTKDLNLGFVANGIFGYVSYDAIPLFENIKFKQTNTDIPLVQYHVFKYIIAINHFNNELYIIENLFNDEDSELDFIKDIIANRSFPTFKFRTEGEETSNLSDTKFLSIIKKGIEHCNLGNLIQVVMSRSFKRRFKGDEFNVYRALRSINPSSYLFFYDYGNFKLFGSSPEAQLKIAENEAVINPIAGTFKRTGDIEKDKQLAEKLLKDPKEIAEHIMLVDLARNDLSKSGKNVVVDKFKQVEYYSHVIHLVSKVKANLKKGYNPIKILAETYPAGTLSGAPKYKAMEIIDENEPDNRGIYGGAIGFIGFNGELNHAIFIRSFISKNNELKYQAGCGIVSKSIPENELNEVNNKLSALRKAVELAKTI